MFCNLDQDKIPNSLHVGKLFIFFLSSGDIFQSHIFLKILSRIYHQSDKQFVYLVLV